MYQSYRNYSRICRQYFYGDKHLEQTLTMTLRNAFKLPLVCQTPVELIKHGAVNKLLYSKEDLLINLIGNMNL